METSDKKTRDWKGYCWPIAGMILAIFVSIATLDHYATTFAIESKMPGDIRAFFQCMSFFGHGTGCLVAASLVWSLDRKNRIAIPLLVGSTLLAGIISAGLKVIIHRPRPFVDPAILGDSVSISEALFHNFLQSFPSGHTATAFALAMGLSFLYRKGKPLFFLFAFLVGLQRIISQNHFPSDVIAG
ncbi:phosphatase PAP2 family protein, partial [bacterium]|nr:phosphatase PAP2 family protein [bacterium]